MGFNYLINLYFIYQYSSRLETSKSSLLSEGRRDIVVYSLGTFNGKPADYIFCLFFLWLCNVVVGSILSIYVSARVDDRFSPEFNTSIGLSLSSKVLMDAMILSVMYIWCQLNKETMMSFWFGMQFKAMYMPWVIMLFNWIISGS